MSYASHTASGAAGYMRRLPFLAAAVLMAFSVAVSSCREDKKPLLPGVIDPEVFPTMMTRDFSSLISDSGIVRYKIEAPLWLVFDEASEPTWKFPDGLHLERFDDMFRQEATIDCDSATYFQNRELWRLDGFVDISNMQGERFLTQQLYWDQRLQRIYSDSFIHIERVDRVIEGYGFESNERMTQYSVRNVSAILPVDRNRDEEVMVDDVDEADDSAAVAAPAQVFRMHHARRSEQMARQQPAVHEGLAAPSAAEKMVPAEDNAPVQIAPAPEQAPQKRLPLKRGQ